jgi:potassium efflux system protein
MYKILSCFICLIALSLPVYAEPDEVANPVLENAQRQLELLDPKAEEDKNLRDLYLQTIDTYSQIDATQLQVDTFKRSLKSLPKDAASLKKKLGQEQQKEFKFQISETQLQELELTLTQLQSTALELQQNRNKIENEINNYNLKPVELRAALAQLKQRTSTDTPAAIEIQQQLNDALFSLKNLKIQSINLELLFIPLDSEYDRLKLSWTDLELLRLNAKIRGYQDKIQQLRQSETDKLLKEISPADTGQNNPAAITDLIEKNTALSDQLRTSVINTTGFVEHLRILEQQHALIQQSYKVIQQQLALSENSFGIELKQFSQRFSASRPNSNTLEQMSKIRLLKIELNQLKLNIAINKPQTDSWSKDSIADLADVQNVSSDLISNLHSAYTRELDELSKIHTLEKQISEQFSRGQTLLTEYLLWLPSVPTVDMMWLQQISNSSQSLLNSSVQHFKAITYTQTQQWLRWIVMLIISIGIAIFCLSYQREHEKLWSRQIGNVLHDRFSRTIKLFLLAPIISLPIPLFGFIFINKIIVIIEPDIQLINKLLCLSLWVFLSFNVWLKRPYGLFISHLDIPEDFCYRLKRLLPPLYILGAPTTWLIMYFDTIPSLELHSGLVRLIFIFLAILAGSFWAAFWRVSPHSSAAENISWWQQAKLWLFSLVIIHLFLIAAILFGYLFTSAVIMALLLALTLIFFTVFSIYRLGVRWLLIAERRISFAKARARRSEILAAREKNEEVPILEENYLGLKSVSEQASVLLKALSFTLLLFSVWLLVKNFLPSLDILEKVVLWQNDVSTASGIISESISLKSIITSLFAIGFTIVAAYNLPGLLELLILRHIRLTPGTSYAITTITRYLLIIFSFIVGASQMGVEWAKLQWLVAALGVGLGFGLQEIVANFVSGIIILFEKPVRIGDTVTIGGVTGKVTKIKIRATTISDWDRKEVIIPNKTFVTDQLINWSLSDAITRVIIKVGVAYGSDTDLVTRLIQNTADSNYRVLQTPEPEVFFTTFGNSTLDFELRFFVDNLGDRNLAIHEINQQLNHCFKEQNISIAFPQLDVHLHRTK